MHLIPVNTHTRTCLFSITCLVSSIIQPTQWTSPTICAKKRHSRQGQEKPQVLTKITTDLQQNKLRTQMYYCLQENFQTHRKHSRKLVFLHFTMVCNKTNACYIFKQITAQHLHLTADYHRGGPDLVKQLQSLFLAGEFLLFIEKRKLKYCSQ